MPPEAATGLLMSPLRLGPVTLRNRIFQPPHQIQMEEDGLPSDRSVAYYAERARGGAALLLAGGFTIDPRRERSDAALRLATDPRIVEGFARIADAVHAEGALISLQLHWNGRAGPFDHARLPALGPSPLPDAWLREVPQEIGVDEIARLLELHGTAAANARAAGLDGLEIFAAQGYGLSQFLSPLANRRTDLYGGSLENRMRLLLEVVARVRTEVGPSLLLGVRLNGDDEQVDGFDVAQASRVAAALEASAQVDYISVSGGTAEHRVYIADMGYEQGVLVPIAAELRAATRLPLAAVVRIKRPEHAEMILRQGHADLIGMNRALIADPELPVKFATGRSSEIRPCIGCNQGCLQRAADGWDLSCTVNPAVGSEISLGVGTLNPAPAARTVVVVGGGPAGMEGARLAALRGHRVILFERRSRLGGQLAMAATAWSRAELGELVGWQAAELERLGVEVRLDSSPSAADVVAMRPDAVIAATGSSPLRTGYSSIAAHVEAIPGHDLPHVLTAWDVLEGGARTGAEVLVLEDDPHFHAVTVAGHLASAGARVTVATRNPYVGMVTGTANHPFWYRRLFRVGVGMVANTWVSRIRESGVESYNVYSGDRVELPAFDTVVLATGNRVEDGLFQELLRAAPDLELHRIGDCLAPRRLDAAMWEATTVGRAL